MTSLHLAPHIRRRRKILAALLESGAVSHLYNSETLNDLVKTLACTLCMHMQMTTHPCLPFISRLCESFVYGFYCSAANRQTHAARPKHCNQPPASLQAVLASGPLSPRETRARAHHCSRTHNYHLTGATGAGGRGSTSLSGTSTARWCHRPTSAATALLCASIALTACSARSSATVMSARRNFPRLR